MYPSFCHSLKFVFISSRSSARFHRWRKYQNAIASNESFKCQTIGHTISKKIVAPLCVLLFNSRIWTWISAPLMPQMSRQRLILLRVYSFPFNSIDRLNWLKCTIEFFRIFVFVSRLDCRRTLMMLIDRLITFFVGGNGADCGAQLKQKYRESDAHQMEYIYWRAAMPANVNCVDYILIVRLDGRVSVCCMPVDAAVHNWIHPTLPIYIEWHVPFGVIYSH